MKFKSVTAMLAAFAVILALAPDTAGAVTERMKRDCKTDYNRYCKKYDSGAKASRLHVALDTGRICPSAGPRALVAGGEMTQAQANRLRKKK